MQGTTGNIPRALGVDVYFPSVSAIMLRKTNISLSPSPENLLKWACVRTELEPQPPSLITMLEGIRKEIPPAVKKKKSEKPAVGRALGLSLLVSMALDNDTGPLWQLSVMGSKNQGRQSLLTPLWYEEAPDTSCGQALGGPLNAALNLRGPGLSQAESPSGSQSRRRSCRAWGTAYWGEGAAEGHRAWHGPTMGHRAWGQPNHRAQSKGTAQPQGTEHGTAQPRGTEHGTAQPQGTEHGIAQPWGTEHGHGPTIGRRALEPW